MSKRSSLAIVCVFLGGILLPFQIDALLYHNSIPAAAFADTWFSSIWIHVSLLLFLSAVLIAPHNTIRIHITAPLFIIALYVLCQGMLTSVDPVLHILGFMVLMASTFTLLVYQLGTDTRKYLLYGLLGGLVLQLFPAIIQVVTGGPLGLHILGEPQVGEHLLTSAKYLIQDQPLLRAYGTFPHPNILGTYACLVLITLWRYLDTESPSRFLRAMQIVPVMLIVLAGSKSVLLILGAAWIYRVLRTKKEWGRIFAPSTLILLAILLFGVSHLSTITDRIIGYVQATRLLLEHPFGVGLQHYTIAMTQHLIPTPAPWLITPVHNVPALLLVELGIPAMLLLLGALILNAKNLFPRISPYFLIFSLLLFTDHALITNHVLVILLFLVLPFFMKASQFSTLK